MSEELSGHASDHVLQQARRDGHLLPDDLENLCIVQGTFQYILFSGKGEICFQSCIQRIVGPNLVFLRQYAVESIQFHSFQENIIGRGTQECSIFHSLFLIIHTVTSRRSCR